MKSRLLISVLALSLAFPTSTKANWDFRSENKSSGITAIANTYWLEGKGPVSIEELMLAETDEGSYWTILSLTCTRKKLVLGLNVNVSGSGNREVLLDDPGFTYLRFDSKPLKKFKTDGSDIPSTILFYSAAKSIALKMKKAKSLSISVRDVNTRRTVLMRFDVSGITKGSTRFRSAGCKF